MIVENSQMSVMIYALAAASQRARPAAVQSQYTSSFVSSSIVKNLHCCLCAFIVMILGRRKGDLSV